MTISTNLKTRFDQKVQALPKEATIELIDPKNNICKISFPFTDVGSIYSKTGLQLMCLKRKMEEKNLEVLSAKSDEKLAGSAKKAEKVFEIIFKDPKELLNKKSISQEGLELCKLGIPEDLIKNCDMILHKYASEYVLYFSEKNSAELLEILEKMGFNVTINLAANQITLTDKDELFSKKIFENALQNPKDLKELEKAILLLKKIQKENDLTKSSASSSRKTHTEDYIEILENYFHVLDFVLNSSDIESMLSKILEFKSLIGTKLANISPNNLILIEKNLTRSIEVLYSDKESKRSSDPAFIYKEALKSKDSKKMKKAIEKLDQIIKKSTNNYTEAMRNESPDEMEIVIKHLNLAKKIDEYKADLNAKILDIENVARTIY